MNALRTPRILKPCFCFLLALGAAQACGPDFAPDTFVQAHPDLQHQFLQGKLGILRPDFARSNLFVAYRYLNGGTLTEQEQQAWRKTFSPPEQDSSSQDTTDASMDDPALVQWRTARSAFPKSPAAAISQYGKMTIRTAQGFEYEDNFLNCGRDAFQTATETLNARAQTWGKTSPALFDWIHAQDAVFSNCSGGPSVPAPAPVGSPSLLLADRAYQIAASDFYGRAFSKASAEFLAISHDTSSPWQHIGGYLAARALIRQAFFTHTDTTSQASYDPDLMRAAEEQLRNYLATNPASEWHSAAEKQLALVRIRLEPEHRAAELATLIGDSAPDANYAQDIQDLLWVTSAKTPDGLRAQPDEGSAPDQDFQKIQSTVNESRQAAFDGANGIRSAAPMLDWVLTFQALAHSAPEHALQQWRKTRSLPWMVAALVLTPDGTQSVEDLLQAAAAIPQNSPAWETVMYHRSRLLLASGNPAAARAALSRLSSYLQQLPASDREPSTENAVRGLRMYASATTQEFFSYASRIMLLSSSEESSSVDECREIMKDPARRYHCVTTVGPQQLDADAAGVFNQKVPLSVWREAAQSDSLSLQLRSALAIEGWTRAMLLGDKAMTASFLPLLPEPLRKQATVSSPLAPWMMLARNPGLRPYLNAGTQRAYSYDFVESYRDNWCYKEQKPDASLPVLFLHAEEQKQGSQEAARIAEVNSVAIGREILRQVKADPGDSQSAEALYLILRMVRYGCEQPAPQTSETSQPDSQASPWSQESKDLLQLKLEAAALLRKNYAGSPWTRKATPFAG